MVKRVFLALTVTLLCYLIFVFFSPLYYSSDSIMAALIVDGFFSSNNISQFQHPLLCIIVRFLTPLFPTADMFTVIIHLTCAVGFFAELFFLSVPLSRKPLKTWRVENYIHLIILILSVIFLSAGVNIWNNNYTITAGAFVFMGVMLTMLRFPTSDTIAEYDEHTPAQTIAGILLLSMGIMLRRESAMMFLPFIALDLTVSIMHAPRLWKQLIRRYLPCILVFIVLLGSRAVFYSFEPYATASRYNAARTAIMDFPMSGSPSGDVDPIDYRAAIDYWVFADTENMDLTTLEAIAEQGTTSQYPLSKEGFQALASKLLHDVFHTNLYMSILVIAIGILLLRNLVCASPWHKVESALAVVGGVIILAYFTFRGRAPMRVWEPVLFATIFVLIRVAATPDNSYNTTVSKGATNLSDETEHPDITELPDCAASQANPTVPRTTKRRPGWCRSVGTICLLLIAIDLWFSAGQVMAYAVLNKEIHTALTARTESNDTEYRTDSLYIWPNWHGALPKCIEKTGKLLPQSVIDHNIALGDWTYGQPYYNEFLSRIGAENPIKQLVDGKAFIMENGIEQFLQLHYGEDVHLVPTGLVIEERETYRVERGAEDDHVQS